MKINGYIKALSFSTNLNKHKVLLDQNMINSITCKPEEVIMDTRHLSGEERQLISDIVKKTRCNLRQENGGARQNKCGTTHHSYNGRRFALPPYRTPITLKPLVKQHINDYICYLTK